MKPEKLFAALADRTRLRILNLLSAGEVCVCYFVEILGESQPKISRHLATLRESGLVQSRRDGKWIHYSIAPDQPAIVQAAIEELRSHPEFRRDVEALSRACCAVKLPASLRDAPRPQLIQ